MAVDHGAVVAVEQFADVGKGEVGVDTHEVHRHHAGAGDLLGASLAEDPATQALHQLRQHRLGAGLPEPVLVDQFRTIESLGQRRIHPLIPPLCAAGRLVVWLIYFGYENDFPQRHAVVTPAPSDCQGSLSSNSPSTGHSPFFASLTHWSLSIRVCPLCHENRRAASIPEARRASLTPVIFTSGTASWPLGCTPSGSGTTGPTAG